MGKGREYESWRPQAHDNERAGGDHRHLCACGGTDLEPPLGPLRNRRSLFRGNGLLTVHIDGCECPNDGFGRRGPNPLAYLALGLNRRIYELDAWGDWVPYEKVTQKVEAWPKWLSRPKPGYVTPLDSATAEYAWIEDKGRENLLSWTDAAAKAAGR